MKFHNPSTSSNDQTITLLMLKCLLNVIKVPNEVMYNKIIYEIIKVTNIISLFPCLSTSSRKQRFIELESFSYSSLKNRYVNYLKLWLWLSLIFRVYSSISSPFSRFVTLLFSFLVMVAIALIYCSHS